MNIIVGSTSERKIEVVRNIFQHYLGDEDLRCDGCNANSNVPETPYDKETYEGCRNRAYDCKQKQKADYYVGLESGLVERYGKLYEEAWACILDTDKEYFGYSSGLIVPEYITNKMKHSQKGHADVMASIEKELNTLPSDTWGIYSGGTILRTISLEEAVRNALIQLLPHTKSLYRFTN